jgi:hypothetical protein
VDDQTRGETPGTGPDFDAPLKRDRERLRSSKPLPVSTPSTPPPASMVGEPEELREPDLTPVEKLFAVQSAAPAVTVPGVRKYDVDLTEGEQADADAEPGKRRLGRNFMRKSVADPGTAERETAETPSSHERAGSPGSGYGQAAAGQALAEPVEQPPAKAVQAAPNHVTPEPHVPPGGFIGPAHPRLGPLAPMPTESHPGLARLDVAAIVAAVVLPPIGLVTAVIALIRGKQIRGWASDLARAAVTVSVVMSVVFASVGGYVWFTQAERAEQLAVVKAEQRVHDRLEAASAPFCDVLAAHPTIYATADPDYGWPALDAPAGYNEAIAEYATVWAQLAEVAPEGIAAETAAISERVAGVVSVANALGSNNRAGDLLGFKAADDLATVESWYVEYCNPPEIPAG